MSRYRGPRRRMIRKYDNLPGLTTKRVDIRDDKNQSIKIKTPGQHGKQTSFFLKNLSSYGLRLVEKQKLRFNYHLTERQLTRYVNQAKKSNQSPADELLRVLEMRLDNIVYRLGMAPTIVAARQLVTHGHIRVNQKKVNIPSYGCQIKDIISIKDTSTSRNLIRTNLRNHISEEQEHETSHLSLNRDELTALIKRNSSRDSVPFNINALLVIEYYSRN